MMADLGRQADFLQQHVRSLLAPFTDTASELRITPVSPGVWRIEGTRRFQKFALDVEASPEGEVSVLSGRRQDRRPLRHVLCEPRFANLDALARSMIPFLQARLGKGSKVVDGYVRRQALDDNGLVEPENARHAVVTALEATASGTRLTFLHGHAGAGKSWLLMKAVLDQTHQFLTRQTTRLDLYVDAQGVNLRTLEQQVARQLDIYNGILRFPEVAPLARLGVLGLVIDGFDELITDSGANDTLRAMYRYVSDFHGQGAIVASARSSFFQLRDLERAQVLPETAVESDVLELVPWKEEEWREYCRLHEQPREYDHLAELARASEVNRLLLGRAFVVAEVVRLAAERPSGIPTTGLLATIEESFAARERTEKLIEPDAPKARPILTEDQFESLLLAVAEEMWRLKQNTLDVETLKTLAGMWAEEWGLAREYRRILVDRIDSNAFLDVVPATSGERRIQFPHEVLFARTLGRCIARAAQEDQKGLVSMLAIAPLSTTITEQLADVAVTESQKGWRSEWQPESLLRKLAEVGRTLRWRSDEDENARTNLGGMACELFRVLATAPEGITLTHFNVATSAFKRARLGNTVLQKCSFGEIDARDTDWSRVEFVECDPIAMLVITAGQRFAASLPPVQHLIVEDGRGVRREVWGWTPARRELFATEGLEAADAQELSERAEAVARVTESLARRARRTFWFTEWREDADDRLLLNLKQSRHWSLVLELLDEHGLLERAMRQRAGVNAEMFHVKSADALLAGRDPADRRKGTPVGNYWEAVERLG